MKNTKIFVGIAFVILFFGCSQTHKAPAEAEVAMMEEVADYVVMDEEIKSEASVAANGNGFISSSAAVVNTQDTTRKFIRTANLKFKVKNVIKSTYDIEDIADRQGGFVTFTHLASNINGVTTTAVSSDSSLVSTYYTVVNDITLRIPNVNLDTTLKEIARNIDFLDYRTIKAQDVALDMLANTLQQKRIDKSEQRLINAIDNRGRKLQETTSAEELLLRKQEQADNAKIANLSLADQISFSTVYLSIYQQQSIKREIISNEKNISAYQPGFGNRLAESFKSGWDILANVVIFVVDLWGIILFIVLAYIVYRKYGGKFRSKK